MTYYYIRKNGSNQGPLTLKQLRSMWRNRAVNGETLFCPEGGNSWKKLATLQSVLESENHAVENPSKGLLKNVADRLGKILGLKEDE